MIQGLEIIPNKVFCEIYADFYVKWQKLQLKSFVAQVPRSFKSLSQKPDWHLDNTLFGQ